MSNRRLVGWIVGVGCVLQFTAWRIAIDTLVHAHI